MSLLAPATSLIVAPEQYSGSGSVSADVGVSAVVNCCRRARVGMVCGRLVGVLWHNYHAGRMKPP